MPLSLLLRPFAHAQSLPLILSLSQTPYISFALYYIYFKYTGNSTFKIRYIND